MRDVLVSQGLPEPEFDFDTGYFAVTIYGREHTGGVLISQDVLRGLSDRQTRLLELAAKHGRVASSQCAHALRIRRKTVVRELGTLVTIGILELKGQGRGSYYVLKGRKTFGDKNRPDAG